MKGPTLKLTPDLNADGLRNYLADTHLDKNAKLRAKKAYDGTLTLYTSTKRSSAFSRMTGRAAEKRQAARKAVDDILGQMETQALKGAVNENMRKPTKDAFRDIRTFLGGFDKSGLRVRNVDFPLQVSKAVIEAAPLRVPKETGAPLEKLDNLNELCAYAAGHLKNGDRMVVANALGDAIGEAMKKKFNDHEKEAFAFSAGIELRQEIDEHLEEKLGKEYASILPPGKERDGFLRAIAVRAASQILPNEEIDANSIRIGTETYTKVTDDRYHDGLIASGGFADVYLYKSQAGEQIAVKFSKPPTDGSDPDDKIAEFGREALVHKAALGNGAKNIIGLKGGFRTEDGRIALALEYAPHGDLMGLVKRLKNAQEQGLISKEAAKAVRLTLLKDMATGLASLERNGIVNGDVKSPNVLIDAKGEARIADLGTAQVTKSYVIADSPSIDNPLWLAPEVLAAKNEIRTLYEHETPKLKAGEEAAKGQVLDALGKTDDTNLRGIDNRMIANLLSPLVTSQVQTVTAGGKGDAWALGVMGLELLSGQEFLADVRFQSEVKGRILDFPKDPRNRAIAETGGFLKPSGDQEVFNFEEEVINRLMFPDPKDRYSADTAFQWLSLAASMEPGVDAAETRDLIKALVAGDQQRMAQASNALTA